MLVDLTTASSTGIEKYIHMMIASLKTQREALGWSQADIAQVLWTTVACIKQWEEGISTPSPSIRRALCELLALDEHTIWPTSETVEQELHEGYTFLFLPHAPSPLPVLSSRGSDNKTEIYDPLLPLPLSATNELIGRDQLLVRFKQHLLEGKSLSLYGLPGVGKTALAIALAHDQEINAQFCDGVVWAGLTPHSSSVDSALSRWGTLWKRTTSEEKGQNIQDTQATQAARQTDLQSTFADRRVLFIFDDVWQANSIDTLRLGGSRCTYVLTTRFAHIAKHLGHDNAFQVPALEENDSLHLLTRFAPEILQDDYDSALNLVHAVGGHPLALTLMSKYLGESAQMGQPRRLHTALKLLQRTGPRTYLRVPHTPLALPSAHLWSGAVSIASVIATSDLHLPKVAQRALRALSVLPAEPALLPQEVALAVADVPLTILDILCDASLLEQRGSTQYMLHTIIADYARMQGIEREASMRMICYGMRFIEAHLTDAAMLKQESTLLQAVLDRAWIMEQYEDFIRGSLLYTPFLLQWGWYAPAWELLQRAYKIVTQKGWLHDQIQVLQHLSLLAQQLGNSTQAQMYTQEALRIAQQVRD
jgi:DNA-binding XRE family transcriptional regulator